MEGAPVQVGAYPMGVPPQGIPHSVCTGITRVLPHRRCSITGVHQHRGLPHGECTATVLRHREVYQHRWHMAGVPQQGLVHRGVSPQVYHRGGVPQQGLPHQGCPTLSHRVMYQNRSTTHACTPTGSPTWCTSTEGSLYIYVDVCSPLLCL